MPAAIQLEAISIVLGPNLHLYNAYLEIKKDADRYRFLRDGLTGNEAWAYVALEDALKCTQQEFDAQVDEAISATTEGEKK